ncbi:MAG TPA: hypothetical protein VH183_01490 [Burkholderiaceae bacterium]|jgi:hypothetical protein|nr:hypothetical protein [Burkholderiaceae bacterium]
MRAVSSLLLVAGLLGSVLCSGCVQLPTEKQGVVDLRPRVAFRVPEGNDSLLGAQVLVDGQMVGKVGDYLDGRNAVRVLSGNHAVQVVAGGQVLLDEKVYLGDGVDRTFLVK